MLAELSKKNTLLKPRLKEIKSGCLGWSVSNRQKIAVNPSTNLILMKRLNWLTNKAFVLESLTY